jgi:hypothetical protein
MNIQLIALRQKAARIFADLDDLRARQKTSIEDLNAPDVRKVYTADHLRGKIAAANEEFVAAAKPHLVELAKIESSLTVAREAWSTSKLMRRARLTHDDASETAQVLAELKRLNLTNDLRDSTSGELRETIAQAAKAGDLFTLEAVRRETGRREFPDSVTKMQVHAALAEAMETVAIPGQPAAHEAIAQATLTAEAARDLISEIETGKEPLRAQARRVGAEYTAREREKAEA